MSKFDKIKDALDERGNAIFERTLKLVRIPSISQTTGEEQVARSIFDEISEWPYFKNHPEFLQLLPIDSNSHFRHNILAMVKGEKVSSAATVLYLGHFDTVDIGEYGDLMDVACDPSQLMKKLGKRDLPAEAAKDLESGEWVFGRGIADMKSGVAVLMQLLKEFSEQVDQLSGNIVMAIVGDEEADSMGMLSAAKPLLQLTRGEKLEIRGAINTDVVSQLPGGAPDQRFMYLGSMGKIVPAVYAVGKAAHVGESLLGFDVNWLLSQLTCRINANMDLADRSHGLVSFPPMSLKQADLKEEYSGQLPYEGYAYYNFLTYQRDPGETIDIIRREVTASFDWCLKRLADEHNSYASATGKAQADLELKPAVYTYDDIYQAACQAQGKNEVDRTLAETTREFPRNPVVELRELSLALVRSLWKMSQLTGPAAVIFIMPPYYPPSNPDTDDDKFRQFNRIVTRTADHFQADSPFPITIDPFFPYLSDASFCAYQEGEENRGILENNMPCWSRGWEIDIDSLKELNIPVLDMGCHGKDFHRFLERVHVPYSMGVLPSLVERMTRAILEESDK